MLFKTLGLHKEVQRPLAQITNFGLGKRFGHQYAPRFKVVRKAQKGRVTVRTGGSIKGSTIKFGTYGLRLKSEGLRLKAIQLKEADNAIMRILRPVSGKLWRRLCTSIPVCIKGNETRMGKGKGAFDHWMARVPTGKIIFEIAGDNLHEKVAREALRKAASKLPGNYEFVTKDHLPRVGLNNSFKEPEPKVNKVLEMKKAPKKELLNVFRSKEDIYRTYRGR